MRMRAVCLGQLLALRACLSAAATLCAAAGAIPALAAPPGMGLGQQANPVYVDDSPAAADTFVRVREHVSAGNLDEAVRVLQVLLDEQPDRLVASTTDSDLFQSVRARTHETLLANPALLERYRATFGPRAERLLGEGQSGTVERALLLTPGGFDAALRLAQTALEDARFEHARLLLEQLDRHPDRKNERARLASVAASLLTRYLDRPDLRDLATRWAKDGAAGAPDLTPIPWPPSAKSKAASVMQPLGPTSTNGMVSKPLWTVPLNPSATMPEANLGMGNSSRGQISLPMFARDLLMLPTVSGDTVYVSDGSQIAAWDRFTLTPRWAMTPGVGDAPIVESGVRGDRRRMDRMNFGGYPARNDDLCTVTVAGGGGRLVIAASGRSGSGSRGDGDDRVQALDAMTGRVRWAVQLNTLDPPALYDATVRGPIEVFENTVVFAARKHLPDRRLVSLSLVGLDVATGKLRWVRSIGSAGSMPWVLQSMGADGATVANGLVFRADRLGVVGAVEVGSGRPRWVRRMAVDTSAGNDQPQAWQLASPIADGGSIVFVSPDMRRIVRLDQSTGAMIGHRDVADLSPVAPKYLLRCGAGPAGGTRLACIGDDRVAFLSAAALEIDKPELSGPLTVPGIRGRCAASGDRLLVPVVGGFHLIDPAHPTEAPFFPLEDSGNILPLDSQLVVLDDARVHSYLQWDVAEALLTKRIEADPKDPTPAVTFAELAYRAGKPERIVGAARQAMSALKAGPQNDSTWNARNRLIEAMQGMLATAMEPVTPASPGALPARPGPGVAPITDRAILEQIVTLLGEVSFEPPDRLAHTLALGRLLEMNEKPADAVAAYQRVLVEPALAGATWRGPQVSIRGELEATRRTETLLKRLGPSIYATQEAAATAELGSFGPTPTEQQLESVAARFPLSQQTPSVWVRLADMRAAANKPQLASGALEAGLRSATRQPAPPEAVVGELAGRLIVGLRERRQLTAAAGVLRTIRTRFPGLALTSAGQPLDADKLGAEIASRIAASTRWPSVGAVRTENAQAIPGWTMLDPLLSDRTPSVTGLLPLVSDEEIGVWTVPTTDRNDKRELLAKAWSAPLPEGSHALLIKATPEAVYLAIVKDSDATIMKIGGSPLETKWHTEPLGKAFGAGDSRSGTGGLRNLPGVQAPMTTPAEGDTQPTNFIVTMDDRTMVLVQRTGRAIAFDTDTGELLWTSRVGVGRVYDIDLASGTLAVGGDQETYGPPPAAATVVELKPVIQLVDARTGRPAQRIGDLGSHVRWVGFADGGGSGAPGTGGAGVGGALIAALDNSVVCLDLASARPNWTISTPEAMPVSAMWIFGDQLVMADQSHNIWLASVSTGRMRSAALEVPRSHLDATQTLDAFPLSAVPGAGFGVSTQQGLALFGPDGALTGVDGMNGSSTMLRPRPADGRAVTIETIADGRTGDGLMMFTLHALDVAGASGASLLDSRPVLLGARPTAMALMDDRVAITAGNVTVILHAPAK